MSRDTSSNDKGVCFFPVYYNCIDYPDNKVHWANLGPIWGRQDPGGPHVGLMNLAIWVIVLYGTKGKSPYILLCRHCTMAFQNPGNMIVQHSAAYLG